MTEPACPANWRTVPERDRNSANSSSWRRLRRRYREAGRDRRTQAILPLRGKILNVEKASSDRVFDSEIRNIYTALGVSVAQEDEDGEKGWTSANFVPQGHHHDRCRCRRIPHFLPDSDFLLPLHVRSYQERSRLSCHPPLYLVKKGKEEVYCWTESQRAEATERLGRGSDKGVTVQRYKGLGEMSDQQLWDTTMDPAKRRLRKITIDNAAQAERTFSMLMGDDVPPRRQFIEENAHYANIDA